MKTYRNLILLQTCLLAIAVQSCSHRENGAVCGENAVEFSQATEQTTDTVRPSADPAATHTIQVPAHTYKAVQPEGIAFPSGSLSDDRYFTVCLPRQPQQEETVCLEYTLEGLSGAMPLALSINNSPAVGGYSGRINADPATASQQYRIPFPSGKFHSGENRLRFHLPAAAGADYRIRDLQVKVEADKQPAHRHITRHITLYPVSVCEQSLYLAGFIRRDTGQYGELTLSFAGKTIPVHDGEFEAMIPLSSFPPSAIREQLYVTGKDGRRDSISIDVIPSGKPDYSIPFREKESPVSLALDALHAGELHLGEAGLTVPDSSLAQPAVFSITALRSTDLPAMDPGLVNVTAGEGGYRFLPHGKHFAHRPATVHLPYDDRLFPEGYTAADVRTFYFDEQHFKWIALPKDSLLESNHVLASLTTHFTDMINGILKVPETPVTGAYTPTTVTGLKAADPSADVQLISAPQATHTGHAAIHYPLIIPPGRAGLQPSLHLSYSSEGGNGWLGNAWDLSLPVLSVETRWGAPLYLADRESESYLMEGSQLTPLVQFQQDFLPREAEKRFYPRVEGSYSQIVRHGDRPDNYWWEVTSTSGLKHYYGGKPGAGVMAEAVLKDANGNIGEWRLVEMRDVNDNFIAFHYALQQDNINGLTAANLYPDHILYTGHGSEEGRYRINFIRRTSPRSDVSSNARMGFLVAESQLLDKVEVLYENELYGACQFHYSAKAFGKTFLDSLVILDSESRRTYSHVLEYYNEIDPAGFYSDEVVINTGNESAGSDAGFINSIKGFRDTPTALGSSKSSGYSAGGSFGAGAYGFLVGGSYSASRNSGEGLVSLMDINGDAIPDKIYKKGRSLYYRPGVAGSALFGTEQLLRGAPEDFSATSSSSSASGINITAIVVTTSYSDTDSKSETSVYLTDFNRDGLPDIAFKGEVYFNHIENGHPVFEKGSLNTPVPIGKSDLDASLIVNDNAAEQAELILKNPLHDIVRLWEAPFDGTVTIEAPVRLLPATDSLAYGFDKRDGVDLRIEHRETLQWSARIGAEDFSVKDCRLENIAVTRGEQIYFRVHSIENGVDDRVEWAPSITYTQITGKASGRNNLPADIPLDGKDINDEPYKSYDARRDFIFAINEPFPLAKTGSVVLESYFEKPVTTDQLHLRASIKDSLGVTTVLMDTLLMGDETWADSLNFNLEVTAKSELSLSLYSPSRIDYSNIHWESVLTYTSIPNAESENGFEPISDRDGRLLYRYKVPVNYTLYDKRLSFALPYTYQHDSCAVVQILPLIAVKNAPTASGNLRMVIKSEHKPEHFVTRDYTFDRYNPQWTDITRQYLRPNSGDTLSLTVEKGDRFHVEYYGDSLAFLSNIAFPGYTFAAYADTLHFLRPDPDPDKDTSYLEVHFVCPPIQTDSLLFADSLAASLYTRVDDSSYGLLHRGWGQFSYNANGDRAGRCIRKSELDADIAKRNTLAQTIGSLSEEDQQNPDIIRSLTEGNRMYNALFAMTPASLMSPEYRYTGYDAAVYVQDSILSASRMGEKEIRLPAWDVSGSSFPAYPKRYRSSGNSLSVGSVYGISMNHSSSDSRFEMEVMDLNGDGFPDLMTPTAITYTSPAGSLSNLAALKRDHALGNGLASSSGSGLGINAGSAVESVMNTFRKKGNGGNSNAADAGGATASDAGKTAQKSVSLSGNFSNSEDYTQAEFIDINGDGLPDKAFRNGTVALNLGYSFTAPIPWGAGLTGGSSKDFGGGLGVSVNAFSFSASTGFGLSRTEGESRIGMLDLNGDGLPDRVSNGGVSFNTGTGFLAETPWHSPSSQHSESVGESVNASFQYTFTIPILVVVVNFSVGVEGSTQHGLSREMTQLRDMNGDGYADIVTADGADKLKVRYAQPGKTYLLKKVINPLGNTFSLDYSATTPTYEDPTHRWRLDRVTLFDGHAGDGVDTLRTAFDYETPHHDRKERTFLGYAKVTSKQLDTANGDTPYRSSIQEYDNTSIYTRGILKTEQTVDASSQLLSLRENSYRYLDATDHSREITAAALPHQTGSIFIALDETTVYSYENAVAIGTATKNEYDAYGNIVRHIDTGSGTPADKVQVDIIYRHDPARYLHALPETVSVSTQEG
ncbi:MAG: hypothetical protein LBP50_02955, partial [Tannerella sp.]|nr:hypothetical protein [Tannerella sp.]